MSNSLNIHVCLLELLLFCLFLPFRTQKIVISTPLNLRRRERLQKIWRKLDYSWSLVFTRRDEDVIGIHKLLCASVHNWTMLHGVTVNIHLNVSYFLVYFWLFLLHFVIDTWFFFSCNRGLLVFIISINMDAHFLITQCTDHWLYCLLKYCK